MSKPYYMRRPTPLQVALWLDSQDHCRELALDVLIASGYTRKAAARELCQYHKEDVPWWTRLRDPLRGRK